MDGLSQWLVPIPVPFEEALSPTPLRAQVGISTTRVCTMYVCVLGSVDVFAVCYMYILSQCYCVCTFRDHLLPKTPSLCL